MADEGAHALQPPDPGEVAARSGFRPGPLLLGVTALALVAVGAAFAAINDGPAPLAVAPGAQAALNQAADVLRTWPDQGTQFSQTSPWPADLAEFRAYTTWLATQPAGSDVNPAALATVTYTLTAAGPCVQTYDEQSAHLVHWTNDEQRDGACPGA